MKDLHRHQHVTEAVTASQMEYRELVDNVNSIIMRIDPQGRFTFVNEFAQRFFGYAEQELLGQPLLEKIVPLIQTHND